MKCFVESSNCKFNSNSVTGIMPATPPEPGWCAGIPLHQGCCQPCQCPADAWAYGPVGIDYKGTMPVCHPGTMLA